MARRSSKKLSLFSKSEQYERVPLEIEDEILEIYTKLTEKGEDLYLSDLPELFELLRIPNCFVEEINQCISYYYKFMRSKPQLKFDSTNAKQYTTINLIHAYCVTGTVKSLEDILDIVDIDKLIRNVARLVKFRDNYKHIVDSFRLFVASASSKTLTDSEVINYKLTLPDLKQVKTELNLDQDSSAGYSLSDSLLIDMLSCCATSSKGELLNFDFNKPKNGTCITIKDFAEILGNLGEYDE